VLEFVKDRELYDRLLCTHIPKARQFIWLATADLKDLYVDRNKKMVPFLELLSDLTQRQVELRLLHAKKPGPIFWKDYTRYPRLDEHMEMMLCPRVHLKTIVIDAKLAYLGSANLTGAGIGAKSPKRRNFESGIITDDVTMIDHIMDHFDGIWRGDHCKPCQRKVYCSAHEDILKGD
jgi:phosphatidylserine/phosphatidylglycerophosphate/cardiolipin synthase-like enzyme